MATAGPYAGEYVACCASARCDYFRKIAFYMSRRSEFLISALYTVGIERMYSRRGLMLKVHPARCKFFSS
jgi:hypothetical protein